MPVPVILWIVLAAAIAILFFWRRFAAGNDYDLVNMHDTSGLSIAKQEATAKTLAQLDRVMTVLIVVTVVYGLAIGGYYIYDAFVNGGKLS
jgi:hypothetical protein